MNIRSFLPFACTVAKINPLTGREIIFENVIHSNTVVEFHDHIYYCSSAKITEFQERKFVAESHEMPLIVIPYFVYPTTQVLQEMLAVDIEVPTDGEHGFKASDLLPCDFNSYGEDKFMDEYRSLPGEVQAGVLSSLARLQKSFNWSVFGQTLIFKELARAASIRNFYEQTVI